MASPRASFPIRQICALHERHATKRIVVFVPRPQIGTALQRSVARERGSTGGLVATTVERYARSIARLSLRAEGLTELDSGIRYFLTATALQRLGAEHQTALLGNQPLSGIIAPLARTFDTLRRHQIDPDAYRRRVDGSNRQEAQAAAFEQYEKLLAQHSFFDTASLFNRAEALVLQSHVNLSATVWAILGVVSLSTVEKSFVETLQRHASSSSGVYRIDPSHGDPHGPSAPPALATSQFREAPLPDPSSASPSPVGQIVLENETSFSTEDAKNLRFWTATGPRREVQAVLEDILDRDRPLDTVEIAYTSSDPYLPLLDSLAERYEIPISLSVGRSLDATRPGQALHGFYDWIANGCPVSSLIELLRAGLILIDTPIEDDDQHYGRLNSHRAATLLAETRYPDDPADYGDTFTAWTKTLESEIKRLDQNTASSWSRTTLNRLREKRAAVRALADTMDSLLTFAQMKQTNTVQPKEMAEGGERFLEQYGPTPKPTAPEEERSPDEAARNRLIERLRAVNATEINVSLPPRRLAGRMKTWMGLTPYVQAQRPQPGRAHIVPLESAGFANRKYLYVVGLDAASTRSPVPDDPLLSDEERTALSDDDRSLPLRSRQGDIEAWRINQALARHEGPITFSTSTYDLREDEDLFEAPLYLQLKERAQAARGIKRDTVDPNVKHHPLAPPSNRVLSDLDRWTSRSRPSSRTLEEAFTSDFPWIQAGLDAADARASDTFTVYDGLLDPGSYPALDPLSRTRPVSAGQLETYAQSPFAYFLQYVLDVQPLDEPALDDVAWLDARGRGGVLHDTFKRFIDHLGRRPTLEDEPALERIFENVLKKCRAELPPPSEVVFASTRRQLWHDALLFLRAEAARSDEHTPYATELGFGNPPHRRSEGDYDDAPTLHLGNLSFSLRGRIDRVDALPDGTYSIWDYKTGSSRRYDETDLLTENFHLQWALYAYAFEVLENATVTSAGYFFTSTDEMGKRIAASPHDVRPSVASILEQMSESLATGAFPVTDSDALRYSYDWLFHDYQERRKQLNAKDWPESRPAPPLFR